MSDPPSLGTARERFRRRFGCVFMLLGIVSLPALVAAVSFAIWYGTVQSELDSLMARIVERGEPIWFSDLAPKSIDPEDDGTPLLMAAIAKLQIISPDFNRLGGNPGADPVLLTTLDANAEALQLLRQAMSKPHLRLPLDFQSHHPWRLRLEPVRESRKFMRLLEGELLYAIGMSDHRRAVRAVEDSFGLCELFRDEPFVITQLVRFSQGGTAFTSLKTLVGHVALTDVEFDALDDRLAGMERSWKLVSCVMAERATIFTEMNHVTTEDLKEHMNDIGWTEESVPDRPWHSFWYRPILMGDQLFALEKLTKWAEVVDEPGPDTVRLMKEFESAFKDAGREHYLSRILRPSIQTHGEGGYRLRQRLAIARLGLRVDRYFMEHKTFPDSLTKVLDNKMKTLPVDLLSGKPLIYRVLPTGFTIYPVGENGIDDGAGVKPDVWEYSCNFEVRYQRLLEESDAPDANAQSNHQNQP
jgi:hypothetical protein